MFGFVSKKEHERQLNIYQKQISEFDALLAALSLSTPSAMQKNLKTIFQSYSFACIEKIASYTSGWSYQIGTEKDGKFEQYQTDNWITELFKKPNNNRDTWQSMLYLLIEWLYANGNAYLYTPIQNKEKPTQMWVLPSDKITPKVSASTFNPDGLIQYYEFDTNGVITTIPSNQICHFKTLVPTSNIENTLYLGESKYVNAAFEEMKIDKAITDYLVKFIGNGGIEAMALSAPDILPNEVRDRLMDAFKKRLEANKVPKIVLESGLKFESLAPNTETLLNSLQNESIPLDIGKKICLLFGVPYSLLSGEFQNRATANTVREGFNTDVIRPLRNSLDRQLEIFFRQWEPDVSFSYNENEFLDPAQQLAENTAYFDRGALTTDEIRSDIGKEPLEPEYRINPTTAAPASPESEEETSGKKRITSMLTKQGINANITIFDINFWEKEIVKRTGETTRKIVQKALKDAVEQVGDTYEESDWANTIRENTKKSTDKISDSINTIHDDLKDTIKGIIEDNPTASKDELLDKIVAATEHKFDNVYTKSRAEMIATTTSTFATASSQKDAWDKLGFDYSWLTQRDKIVRDSHKKMDGKKPVKGKFTLPNGEQTEHPAGSGLSAEEAVNCRCYLVALAEKGVEFTNDELDLIWKSIDDLVAPERKKLEKEISGTFEDLGKVVVKNIEKLR